jgi:hypothetical protein
MKILKRIKEFLEIAGLTIVLFFLLLIASIFCRKDYDDMFGGE